MVYLKGTLAISSYSGRYKRTHKPDRTRLNSEPILLLSSPTVLLTHGRLFAVYKLTSRALDPVTITLWAGRALAQPAIIALY